MENFILFYDSGIGGLSTLAKTIQLLPHEHFLYFADNKNVPYGNKSSNEILDIVSQNISHLLKQFPIKLVVIACNTATGIAIEFLRKNFLVPFIGIEPSVCVADKKSKTKEILVVATKATICSERYFALTKKVKSKVYSCFFTKLANKIEHGFLTGSVNIQEEINLIQKTIQNHPKIDQLVLGCTHYSFVSDKLSDISKLPVSDGNFGVAKNVMRTLEKMNNKKTKGFLNIQFVFSKDEDVFRKKYTEILEKLLENPI